MIAVRKCFILLIPLSIGPALAQAKEAADEARQEIAVLESFLPQQLSEEELEVKVRAHLADHPEINHAGRLTGVMKKELGDLADGRMLNAVCQRVLGD